MTQDPARQAAEKWLAERSAKAVEMWSDVYGQWMPEHPQASTLTAELARIAADFAERGMRARDTQWQLAADPDLKPGRCPVPLPWAAATKEGE